jgi:hypothetical protein
METDVKSDLYPLDELYSRTQANGSSKLPDGTYQVKVDKVRLVRSKDQMRLMLIWELVCVSGEHEGEPHTHIRTIDADNMKWLKGELAIAGVQISLLSELPDHLEDALDTIIEITVKTSHKDDRDYTNTYFRKQVGIHLGEEVPF